MTQGQHKGFSLIELMVVVAIIGILSMIAIPQYTSYITRSRITEAVSALSSMRVRMEQYFQDNRTYVGACQTGTLAPLPTNSAYFQYACPAANLTATTYTATATGIGAMNGFVYTIDQNNVRATTSVPIANGWQGAPQNCWILKPDGSC
ncbi:MAG TPA: type IV pilin protein [Rhodocyclaceae bacterium]|jgi:type IV pilus assembly protein PilE